MTNVKSHFSDYIVVRSKSMIKNIEIPKLTDRSVDSRKMF